MPSFDLAAHDALATWLGERFGAEGTAMLNANGPGLDRIRPTFSAYIENLKSCKVITIAGTNGKGECAYRVEQQLIAKGYKVALWTSPHLVSVTERMRFSGKDVSAKECQDTFSKLESVGQALSYYEFLFLSFLSIAHSKSPDVLVLEVGLGGRLDAVNLFDADISAVCSIGRDHQAILGNSLEGILYEKLGVTRAGKLCLSALESDFLRTKAKKWCEDKNVSWWDAFDKGFLEQKDLYPRRNQVLSSAIVQAFESQDKFCFLAPDIQQEFFPGRREVMTLGQLSFIFIGAHNVDGFRQAVRLWCNEGHPDEIWVSFSSRPLKDLQACIGLLAQLPSKVRKVLTVFEHPRAQASETLQKLSLATHGSVGFEANWKELIEASKNKNGSIAIAGSYYFVGAVMRQLLKLGSSRS